MSHRNENNERQEQAHPSCEAPTSSLVELDSFEDSRRSFDGDKCSQPLIHVEEQFQAGFEKNTSDMKKRHMRSNDITKHVVEGQSDSFGIGLTTIAKGTILIDTRDRNRIEFPNYSTRLDSVRSNRIESNPDLEKVGRIESNRIQTESNRIESNRI